MNQNSQSLTLLPPLTVCVTVNFIPFSFSSSTVSQVSLNNEPPHYHDNSSQVDRIGQLESIVAILRNQLLTTEDLFKKALLSKKSLEGANCDLLTVVDKLKLDLVHSESRRKLTEDHNMRMEADLEALRNRMLEKDTEISSLRLTLAKIVRSTGYNLTENELALLRGKTIASDFIKNVSCLPLFETTVY